MSIVEPYALTKAMAVSERVYIPFWGANNMGGAGILWRWMEGWQDQGSGKMIIVEG